MLTAAATMSSGVVGRASTAHANQGDDAPLQLINGSWLTVAVGDAFPQVVSYKSGNSGMGGQSQALSKFLINGQEGGVHHG